MKQFTLFKTWLLVAVLMLVGVGGVWGQGTESFTHTSNSTSYVTISWTGDNGLQWSSTDSRGDQVITTGNKAVTVRTGAITGALTTAQQSAGVGTISFDYKIPYSDATKDITATITAGSKTIVHNIGKLTVGTVYNTGAIQINSSDASSIVIAISSSVVGARLTIDNLVWTAASLSCTPSNASFVSTSVTKSVIDGSFTNTFTTDNTSAKSYTSSDTNVATVNASSGAVTIVGIGTTTISVTQVEDGTHCEVNASYELTVNPIPAPVATAATNLDETGFTANWNAVSGVSNYKLSVYSGSVFIDEDFSAITAGNNTSTSGSSSAWSGNDNFPTVATAYQAGGATRLGTGTASGSITSREIDLSQGATLTFDVKGWTNVEGDIQVVVDDGTPETVTYIAKMADAFETKTVALAPATTSSKVQITFSKRAFITNVKIANISNVAASPFSVTGTSKEVTDIDDGTEYFYTVKAISGTHESDWSNEINVTTLASGPSIYTADLSLNFDVELGNSDQELIFVTGNNLTENMQFAISGDDKDEFSVTPSVEFNYLTGGDLTVSYNPTDAGNHSATLTISSDGADNVEITLCGVAIIPLVLEGEGTKANPYTCSDVKLLNNSTNPEDKYWVKGYIIGVPSGGNADGLTTVCLEAPFTNATAIALAPSSNETDLNTMIGVQLPAGDVRTALNLQDNPNNLNKELLVYGTLEGYFSEAPGVKNVTDFELEQPEQLDWVNLQWPGSGEITLGGSYVIYGQVYHPGITTEEGNEAAIQVWVGYNSTDTNPNTWTDWVEASFDEKQENNYQYMLDLGAEIDTPGTYYYAFRYKLGDAEYVYGGFNNTDGKNGGFWGGDNVSGVLTINTDTSKDIGWGNVQWPLEGHIFIGEDFAVYGQVYKDNVTDQEDINENVKAWLGFTTDFTTNPANWDEGAWSAATFNEKKGSNYEFGFNIASAITSAGEYYYVYRYQYDNGAYYYGGTNNKAWNEDDLNFGELTVDVLIAPVAEQPSGNLFKHVDATWSKVSGVDGYILSVYQKEVYQDVVEHVTNGSFETWTGTKPDGWFGSTTSIAASNVKEYIESAQDGSKAVQLINATTSHKRFSTDVVKVQENTEYTIAFWARGKGDIRTGIFDGRTSGSGYASYNDYVNVDSDVWTEYSQTVTATEDTNEAEFIFSVVNTVVDNGHLQIDNVSIVAELEVENILQLDGSPVTVTDKDNVNENKQEEDPFIYNFTGLERTTEYYYSVVAYKGDLQSPVSNEIKFTSGPRTDVDQTTFSKAIYAYDAKVFVNTTAGESIDVFNIAGQKISTSIAHDGLNIIPVNYSGIVLVKVGDKVVKLSL